MAKLKGIIFSLRDVLAPQGPVNKALFEQTIRLLRFLKQRGIAPVFANNHDWVFTTTDGKRMKGTGCH